MFREIQKRQGVKMTKTSKKYNVIPTKEQLKLMKEAWKRFKQIEELFYGSMGRLEKQLSKETGIKDIEFIKDDMCGGDWVGIGNVSRTMKLHQREELENDR